MSDTGSELDIFQNGELRDPSRRRVAAIEEALALLPANETQTEEFGSSKKEQHTHVHAHFIRVRARKGYENHMPTPHT